MNDRPSIVRLLETREGDFGFEIPTLTMGDDELAAVLIIQQGTSARKVGEVYRVPKDELTVQLRCIRVDVA